MIDINKVENCVNIIQKELDILNQSLFLDKKDISKYKNLVKSCKDLLLTLGFKVVHPYSFKYNDVRTVRDLVNLFYNLLKYYYPDKMGCYVNEGADLKHMREFIDTVMASGVDEAEAIKECAEVMATIFENKESLCLEIPPYIAMFVQSKWEWLVKSAFIRINKRRDEFVSKETTRIIEEATNKALNRAIESNELGFDVDKLYENIVGGK